MSTTTLSQLRQRMIQDMRLRNLAPRTQQAYIRGCRKLASFLRRSPDTASAEDIRLFQLHLAEQGVSICTRNRTMTGIASLFRVTLRRPEIADQIECVAEPQKIPLVLSPEEVRRLLAAAPGRSGSAISTTPRWRSASSMAGIRKPLQLETLAASPETKRDAGKRTSRIDTCMVRANALA